MANEKKIMDELNAGLTGDYTPEEGFSLESILAEYKGSAFLEGDKKTPAEELQRRTDEILREAMSCAGAGSPQVPAYEPEETEPEGVPEPDGSYEDDGGSGAQERPRRRSLFSRRRSRREQERVDDGYDGEEDGELRTDPVRPYSVPAEPVEELSEPAYETAPKIDLSVFDEPDEDPSAANARDEFLDSLRREPFVTDGEFSAKPAEEDRENEREERGRRGFLSGLFGRKGGVEEPEEDESDDGDGEEEYPEDDGFEDDGYIDVEPDPDFRAEAQRYASRVPSLRFRIFGAAVLTILLAFFTWSFSTGHTPFGIERAASAVAFVTILELFVIALGLDVMIRGLEDILTLRPGVESLVFVSCVMSVMDGFSMLVSGRLDLGLPLGVVSSVSMIGALSARKSWYMALCDSLRSASASASAYGVTTDTQSMEGRNILKKVTGEPLGFYTKLTAPDCGEALYDEVAPLLVIASFVLSFLSSVGHGDASSFTHSFSIMTAVSAAFPAAVIFALPFKYAASNLKKAGGAIAGYEGAGDIYESDGALITDLDIFPVGSVSMSGVKIFEGMDAQKVIAYTSSLIIASDSGLRRVFEEVLSNQGLTRRRIDDFACYDGGGIGGLVEGQRVLVGTGAFMSLMGLRVPESINAVGSVFTAINDELAGVFSLSYVPSNSVQSALVALLGTRTSLFMAVRDFNVTPNTVKQKFKVSMDGVDYLPIETTYELSQNEISPEEGVSAVLVRGGLAPFAEVITRGRLLKLITKLNTWVTGIGTAMAMVIMFFLCWSGAFASASAFNIFLFMSVIGLAVYIMSQGVRKRMK